MAHKTIYKLMGREEWEAAQAIGVYRGSAHDQRDGFIHFSTAAQLGETARKHFSGVADLVLLAVGTEGLTSPHTQHLQMSEGMDPHPVSRSSNLQSALKWETSRGGDRFPHLYGELSLGAVISATPLPLGVDGVPVLPQDLAS
jgi:uncharacterized protein (DUF952 family)